jgi:hypothetical protein
MLWLQKGEQWVQPIEAGCLICRSVDEEVLDRVRGYHETEAYKKTYRKRTVWVEPLFAEGNDWHGMRRIRLRRLWRVNRETLMRAAGQNLKRLLKRRGWGRRPCPAEAVCAFFLAWYWLLTRLSLGYASPCLNIPSLSLPNKHKSILASR